MAAKDFTEKTLEAYNDVFADIINVLLFNGKLLVGENELSEAAPRSIYKADGKLHELERDVAKYWRRGLFRMHSLDWKIKRILIKICHYGFLAMTALPTVHKY